MIGFLGNLAIIVDLYCHYYLLKKALMIKKLQMAFICYTEKTVGMVKDFLSKKCNFTSGEKGNFHKFLLNFTLLIIF